MVRLQLYNLVSSAAVAGYWQRCRRGAASEELWSQARPGQCPVSIMVMAAAAHIIKVWVSYDKLNVTNDETNMLKTRDHIQIACRQDEDSRSTRCLLEIKWIKNELSLNPSYFMRFSVILIWRLWSKELSMSIKSILHMIDVLNWQLTW